MPINPNDHLQRTIARVLRMRGAELARKAEREQARYRLSPLAAQV